MDNKDLVRWLKKNGFQLIIDGKSHYAVYDDSGTRIGNFGYSPHGGKRSMQNTIADLRRKGVPIPRK